MTAGTQVQGQNSPSRTMDSLPQYGFGSEHSFENLIQDNPFLYRVYTPKARSPFFDPSEPFFISHSAGHEDSSAIDDISAHVTYGAVAKHMDWTTRSTSPFISTSFSFVWAIWEAVRRYRSGVKHDIEIAVIDSRAVSGQAVTAIELLRKGTPEERHADYWKWYRFSVEAQDVLVHGSIPGTAVLASIPLFSILSKLPSYLLQPDVLNASVKESPFEQLGWDCTERKPSYRQLCQDMSAKFLRMPDELRLRDTTAGSVRLAVAFLRPWLHKMVQVDFDLAKTKLCELAFVIAQWPGQWWIREHNEIWDLTRLMVQTLGEELREKQQLDASEEVKSLQIFVDNLENMVQMYQTEVVAKAKSKEGKGLSSWAPKSLYPFIPKRMTHRRSDTDETLVDLAASHVSGPQASECKLSTPQALESKPLASKFPELEVSDVKVGSPMVSEAKASRSKAPDWKAPEVKVIDFTASEGKAAKPDPNHQIRPHSMVETISCVCTGLFLGAFITLCIMNGQRRTLIMNLT